MSEIRWLSLGIQAVPPGDDWLSPKELAWAGRMRFPKRLSEYRLARWCAKTAIAAILEEPPPPSEIEIGHLPEGAPAGYVSGHALPLRISMTDRADWAVCVIGPSGVEVGCDLELVEPRSGAFVRDYFVSSEQRAAFVDGVADPLVSNAIWSAKESALKVLRTGLRRDTRSVVVDLGTGDPGDWTPLRVDTMDARSFPGWWRRSFS